MNSLERTKAAIHFNDPDRVPIFSLSLNSDVFPLQMMNINSWQPGYSEDEVGLFPHTLSDLLVKYRIYRWKKPEWAKRDPRFRGTKWLKYPREEIDEFGVIWQKKGENLSIGYPGRPHLTDYSKMEEFFEKYNPDPYNRKYYSLMIKLSKILGRKRYKLAFLGFQGPFQTAYMLRGFSNYLVDHMKKDRIPYLKRLLEHLTDYYIKVMKAWKKYGAHPDAFGLIDDLGEQNGPFFSPRLFKKFYEPVYRRIFETAHDLGCDTYLHCCGKVDKILPILIEWGLDQIEFDSPRMSGYNDLKPFRGKIMFWGCVNIQSIYVNGSPEECEREVWHMMRNLGNEHGGYGAYFYPQPNQIHAPKENINGFKRGLKKYGVYKNIPKHWWDYPVENDGDWSKDYVPELPPQTPKDL
ncbi:MAG: uroporphyrinogen decarboxylase family protein [Promethearchaeota archaeon]